jgi:hypothetical protein
VTAPPDWIWSLFPLVGGDTETVNIESVVHRAMELVNEAAHTGDHAPIGPVMHWAHIFKSEQGTNGDWPAKVNGRTGEAVSAVRTVAPAALMARLDALLESSEYVISIEAAAQVTLQGESDGTRGTDHHPGR